MPYSTARVVHEVIVKETAYSLRNLETAVVQNFPLPRTQPKVAASRHS